MKTGKLPHDLLASMLERIRIDDPRVVVGPRVGEDAAAIDFGDRLLVAKTDPITFATDVIGWYAVHVNANDIASMGAEPRWFLASVLVPESAADGDVSSIFDQICEACDKVGATLVGGHTEITLGLDRPIVAGCMLGETRREALVTSGGARPGDAVILSGGIAVEGTALLAREAPDELVARGMAESSVAKARDLLFEPGISVVPAARAAVRSGAVTALHDPTEGGLATGLRELAIASGVGLEIDGDAVPVLDLTREVCEKLDLDALGLIASGSLIITARPEGAEEVLSMVREAGVEAAVIGQVAAEDAGMWMVAEGKRRPLPQFARDELARFLEGQS
jgi:hydrogenase expression/formation protein HypE